MKADDVRRLKELGKENQNQNFKAIVADQVLQVRALKEVSQGNW